MCRLQWWLLYWRFVELSYRAKSFVLCSEICSLGPAISAESGKAIATLPLMRQVLQLAYDAKQLIYHPFRCFATLTAGKKLGGQ